jgi:hypothetical protein
MQDLNKQKHSCSLVMERMLRTQRIPPSSSTSPAASEELSPAPPKRVSSSISNNGILDNIWIWRADHSKPGTVGWDSNPSATGFLVNGDQVMAYSLFVEHHQNLRTIWNGNFGQVYFYQSEIPYSVPDQKSWQ